MKITRTQLRLLIKEALNEGTGIAHVKIEIRGKDHNVAYKNSNGNVDVLSVKETGGGKKVKCWSWYDTNRNEIMDGLRYIGVSPEKGKAYTFEYDWDDKPLYFGCEF